LVVLSMIYQNSLLLRHIAHYPLTRRNVNHDHDTESGSRLLMVPKSASISAHSSKDWRCSQVPHCSNIWRTVHHDGIWSKEACSNYPLRTPLCSSQLLIAFSELHRRINITRLLLCLGRRNKVHSAPEKIGSLQLELFFHQLLCAILLASIFYQCPWLLCMIPHLVACWSNSFFSLWLPTFE